MDDNRLSIMVDSFDGYSDVWPYFFETFNKFWEDCPFSVFLVSNDLECGFAKTIKTGKEIDWVTRTKKALENIETPYVMLLLEDYFLSKSIDNALVKRFVDFSFDNDINYLRLVEYPKSRLTKERKQKDIVPICENEEYGVNLQASIWKKEYLLEVLNSMGCGSAWSFEVFLLNKATVAESKQLPGCYTLINNPMGFHNGILKGKWFPKEIRFYKRKNITIDYKRRGKLSFWETLGYNLKVFLKSHISYRLRKRLKRILRRFGFKFVSDL